jgi:hypothetical protein
VRFYIESRSACGDAFRRAIDFRESEVENLHLPAICHEDVLGLDVAMDDAKKAAVKTKAVGKKTIGAKTVSVLKKRGREESQSVDTGAFSPEGSVARSGRQSGDLQGLSRASRVRIRRVSASCSRKETRSRPTS